MKHHHNVLANHAKLTTSFLTFCFPLSLVGNTQEASHSGKATASKVAASEAGSAGGSSAQQGNAGGNGASGSSTAGSSAAGEGAAASSSSSGGLLVPNNPESRYREVWPPLRLYVWSARLQLVWLCAWVVISVSTLWAPLTTMTPFRYWPCLWL